MLGKLQQRCALIRGRWYSQRDAAVHSWLIKQLVIPKQSFPFWITHRGVWYNFKCLKFITDDWTLRELVQNCLRIICFLLLFLYKQWVLMFLRHVGNVWMQAMMPQTQHMLTSDRGRILMLLTTTSCQASMNWKVLEATVLRQVLFGDISRRCGETTSLWGSRT